LSALSGDVASPLPRTAGRFGSLARSLVLGRLPAGTLERARVVVRDDRAFLRILFRGEMGAGEAYVAGEWDAPDLVGAIRTFLHATGARGIESPLTWLARLPNLVRHRLAANSPPNSRRNVGAHYDLGNDFYRLFLDETMAYSCALWDGAVDLDAAQTAKHARLCDVLDLGPADHLLEIGCGWGGMAIHAARTRGCRVTAITVSREQHALATARVAAAGLADRVAVLDRDYRTLDGRFDKIVSIEMLEAVGYEFLPRFFATCSRLLRPGGRLAIQTITMPDDRFDAYRRGVDWMQTYIFPGTLIPSLGAIQDAIAATDLIPIDVHDIGPDYVPTLRAWRDRLRRADHAGDVRRLGFDDAFLRTWNLYLAFSEAAFAEHTLADHQLLFVRDRSR
jgi:cyclopropane-fatty-acyl-phospholipid synthase